MDLKKSVGLFKKKIEIGDNFYKDDGTPYDIADVYIVMREPTVDESNQFQGDGSSNIKFMKTNLPKWIVEHNFTSGEELATNDEVAKLIISSSSCFMYVMEVWQSSLPLVLRNAKRLKEQQEASSQGT